MKSILNRGVYGALAGLAGAFAMLQFRRLWERRAGASLQTGIFGFDEEADLNSVDQLWSLSNLPPLPREEALQVALLLHFAFGAGSGAAYAILAEKYPASKTGYGTAFGAALWLIGDELAITTTGLSDPRSKAPAAHFSALFAHLLFGVVTEFGCRTTR